MTTNIDQVSFPAILDRLDVEGATKEELHRHPVIRICRKGEPLGKSIANWSEASLILWALLETVIEAEVFVRRTALEVAVRSALDVHGVFRVESALDRLQADGAITWEQVAYTPTDTTCRCVCSECGLPHSHGNPR